MGDDEHQRMICLFLYLGFIKLFFSSPRGELAMAFDFAIPLHISLCDLETQEGRLPYNGVRF
jgi:hypothetical protein